MRNRTFIAVTKHGVQRAKQTEEGWQVEPLFSEDIVYTIAHAQSSSKTIYIGTKKTGVLCSDDGGTTWSPMGLAGSAVKSLAVSPQNPLVVYAGVRPAGVYASEDGGQTWRELEGFHRIRGRRFWRSPAEPPDFRAYVQGLAVSPEDPNHIVAGIELGALVQSKDGGKNWSNHKRGALRDCHSLTFHTNNASWVYEGGGGGAAVSNDNGETWRQPKTGLDRRYGWACAADPERPEIWYLTASPFWPTPFRGQMVPAAHIDGQANAAIYRSSGGAVWEQLNGGLPQPMNYMPYALLTDPNAPGHLYAGFSNGEVWQTSDYGENWQQLPFNMGSIYRLIFMD